MSDLVELCECSVKSCVDYVCEGCGKPVNLQGAYWKQAEEIQRLQGELEQHRRIAMDSEHFFKKYGRDSMEYFCLSTFTVEELYQHFAERFRRENKTEQRFAVDDAEISIKYDIIEIDTN